MIITIEGSPFKKILVLSDGQIIETSGNDILKPHGLDVMESHDITNKKPQEIKVLLQSIQNRKKAL